MRLEFNIANAQNKKLIKRLQPMQSDFESRYCATNWFATISDCPSH
jgi:hypothetical protein